MIPNTQKELTKISQIPLDNHLEIQRYCFIKDLEKVSRTCKHLHEPYNGPKWRSVVVANHHFLPMIITKNRQIIPFAMFLNPKLFSWFPPYEVLSIDFVWDPLNDILILGQFSLEAKKLYPNLTHINFNIAGDYSKLFYFPKYVKSLNKFLSLFYSASIKFTFSLDQCKSNQRNSSIITTQGRNYNLNCFGVNYEQIFLNIGPFCSVKISNLNKNTLRILYVSAELISIEMYSRLCKSLISFPNLESFVSLHSRFETISAMSFVPSHIRRCKLILVSSSSCKNFTREENNSSEIDTQFIIPQVKEIIQITTKDKTTIENCSKWNNRFWEVYQFPNLKVLNLTKMASMTKCGFALPYVPVTTIKNLTDLNVILWKNIDRYSLLYNLKSMVCLKNLTFSVFWNSSKDDARRTSIPVVKSAKEHVEYMYENFTKRIYVANEKTNGSYNFDDVINGNTIVNYWNGVDGNFSIQKMKEILLNPKQSALSYFSALEKKQVLEGNDDVVTPPLGNMSVNFFNTAVRTGMYNQLHNNNHTTNNRQRVPQQMRHYNSDFDFEESLKCRFGSSNLPPHQFGNISSFESTRSEGNNTRNSINHMNNTARAGNNSTVNNITSGLPTFSTVLTNLGAVNEGDALSSEIVILNSIIHPLFFEAIFGELGELPNLKNVTIESGLVTFAIPRLFDLVKKHKSLESLGLVMKKNEYFAVRNPYQRFVRPTRPQVSLYNSRQYNTPYENNNYTNLVLNNSSERRWYTSLFKPYISRVPLVMCPFTDYNLNEDYSSSFHMPLKYVINVKAMRNKYSSNLFAQIKSLGKKESLTQSSFCRPMKDVFSEPAFTTRKKSVSKEKGKISRAVPKPNYMDLVNLEIDNINFERPDTGNNNNNSNENYNNEKEEDDEYDDEVDGPETYYGYDGIDPTRNPIRFARLIYTHFNDCEFKKLYCEADMFN